MQRLSLDVRQAIRSTLAHWPRSLLIAVSLGLGVGLNTAVFSFVDAAVLHPFPYPAADRLALVWGSPSIETRRAVSGARVERWRDTSRSFDGISAVQLFLFSITVGDADVATLKGAYVDHELFALLGTPALIGRTFGRAVSTSGDAEAVVLSHGTWVSHFGADRGVIGRTVRLNGTPHTVIGVMPPRFFFPDRDAGLWLPLTESSALFGQAHALGRLKAGVSAAQAAAELQRLEEAERAAVAGTRTGPRTGPEKDAAAAMAGGTGDVMRVGVFTLHEVIVGKHAYALWTLLAIVLLLVLLACANVSNLLIARGVGRRRELAVLAALGASPFDLGRLVLVESLLLAALAAATGVFCAWGGIRLINSLSLIDITGLSQAALNPRVLMFGVAVALVAGTLAGVIPALQAASAEGHSVLQQRDGDRRVRRGMGPRDLLVSIEVALALVLVVSAGLLIGSFVNLTRTNWGFDPANLLIAHVNMPKSLWFRATPEQTEQVAAALARQAEYTDSVLERLRSLPGVGMAAVARDAPLDRGEWTYRPLVRTDRPGAMLDHVTRALGDALVAPVSPDYFRTLGVPLLQGREFTEADAAEGRRLAMVDQQLANRMWPGESPLGKQVSIVQPKTWNADVRARGARGDLTLFLDPASIHEVGGGPHDIVGVVGSVRQLGLDHASEATLYTNLRQSYDSLGARLVFMVRTDRDPEKLAGAVKDTIRSLRTDMTVQRIGAMEQRVDASIGGRGSNKLLLVTSLAFGTLSLLLAGAGVYGVVSHRTVQRTREIGTRVALGATPRDILGMIVRESLRPVVWGTMLGIVSAWAFTRVLRSLLFGVAPTDLGTFAAVVSILLGVTVAACLIPSIRAVRSDPVAALRHE